MESHYESDEDVCWGPVTVKELRRDLLAVRAKEDIGRRNSIECNPSFKQSRDFIDKIAEILEGTSTSPSTSFNTAAESDQHSDKHMLLDDIHLTFNNTVTITPVQFEKQIVDSVVINEDVVILSSDEDDGLDKTNDYSEDCIIIENNTPQSDHKVTNESNSSDNMEEIFDLKDVGHSDCKIKDCEVDKVHLLHHSSLRNVSEHVSVSSNSSNNVDNYEELSSEDDGIVFELNLSNHTRRSGSNPKKSLSLLADSPQNLSKEINVVEKCLEPNVVDVASQFLNVEIEEHYLGNDENIVDDFQNVLDVSSQFVVNESSNVNVEVGENQDDSLDETNDYSGNCIIENNTTQSNHKVTVESNSSDSDPSQCKIKDCEVDKVHLLHQSSLRNVSEDVSVTCNSSNNVDNYEELSSEDDGIVLELNLSNHTRRSGSNPKKSLSLFADLPQNSSKEINVMEKCLAPNVIDVASQFPNVEIEEHNLGNDENIVDDFQNALLIPQFVTNESSNVNIEVPENQLKNVLEDDHASALNIELEENPNHSFDFDDTLEEMERALNEGLNYSMSMETTNAQKNIQTTTSEKNTKFLKPKKPTRKYDNILSPVAAYIVAAPRRFEFKQPAAKPYRNLSPVINTNYKSVASPVGVYIKNAPTTPLYKKITPTVNARYGSCHKSAQKENLIDSFPEVIYKPAKHTIVKEDVGMRLPNNIESLLPIKSTVIRHEVRTRKQCESISRRVLEDDLSLNSTGLFDVSSQDTSIRTKKRTYINRFPPLKDL